MSRRFVARTSQQVGKYLSRPLDEIDLPAIVIDGTQMAKHLLVIAIGIDTDGHKHVLGVVEGSTESAAVGRALLRQLIERGLPVERARLIVMDGSKGLRKAVRDTFGDWALIQRCRVHKLNNVLEHLPRHIRPWFAAKIRKAFKAGT
ncbi:transposase, partial [Acidobacteriia bacterium AH_259_A11_L15]|nr:transposase [Acidobacteriia bacterium AH_259_A11_L15]